LIRGRATIAASPARVPTTSRRRDRAKASSKPVRHVEIDAVRERVDDEAIAQTLEIIARNGYSCKNTDIESYRSDAMKVDLTFLI